MSIIVPGAQDIICKLIPEIDHHQQFTFYGSDIFSTNLTIRELALTILYQSTGGAAGGRGGPSGDRRSGLSERRAGRPERRATPTAGGAARAARDPGSGRGSPSGAQSGGSGGRAVARATAKRRRSSDPSGGGPSVEKVADGEVALEMGKVPASVGPTKNSHSTWLATFGQRGDRFSHPDSLAIGIANLLECNF
ncbi:hypothetical protein GUJ93_ZPchr0013g36882 [Zizania palustris]|uniref:Uncharacterized protein n=1 Tax=Zizania palustris TaxID=103762 RepID=A0A8J5X2Q5_ZIZPA|nr:hypothetical protein GUJ93_ZPchr0013g36882 [Zizania palustris]